MPLLVLEKEDKALWDEVQRMRAGHHEQGLMPGRRDARRPRESQDNSNAPLRVILLILWGPTRNVEPEVGVTARWEG